MALGALRFRVDLIEVRRGPVLAPDDREKRTGIHLTIREETISLLDEAMHSCATRVERSGRQVPVCASAESTAQFDGCLFESRSCRPRLSGNAMRAHDADCDGTRYSRYRGGCQGEFFRKVEVGGNASG